jgi:thioredoxin-dependent peroxiredoxin
MIDVGQPAPAFARVAHDGSTISTRPPLSKVLVLYFYPKDETGGCTAQACAFRDSFESFGEAGAIVVGVSDDNNESHRSFAEHRRLPFPLLADESGELRKAFDVPNWLGLLRNRVTFVIDKGGVVRHVFQSQLRATQHVDEALRIVRQLAHG